MARFKGWVAGLCMAVVGSALVAGEAAAQTFRMRMQTVVPD